MVNKPHPAKPQNHETFPTDEAPKTGDKPKAAPRFTHPYAVFNLYAQATSLDKLNFFGLGNDTLLTGKSLFGMTQTIVGASVIKPAYELSAIRGLNLALLGEVHRRI